MKVEIYLANNLIDSAKNMLKSIKKEEKTYVIVPDRFSLTVEKQVMELLNIQCCYNIEVLPLSRLCNKYIKTENKKLLSKNESIMLIRKCIIENQERLQCFKNSSKTENFSESIFETIMQLKSCNITPNELDVNNNFSSSLNLKLEDIKCIYLSYEKYLKEEYIDSFNKLNLFCENLYKYSELKKHNIYFAYFDNFTPLILKVINAFMKECKSVNFALQMPNDKQNNSQIYSSDMYNSIMLEAKSLNIEPIINHIASEISVQEHLRQNLYAYTNKVYITRQFAPNLISFSNMQDEIEYICSDIKKKIVKDNFRFKDFSIACANTEGYFLALKNQLKKYNIPFYIDTSKTLKQTYLTSLILNCLNYYNQKNVRTIIYNILDNPILQLADSEINNFKNFCLKYNVNYGYNKKFKIGINEKNYNEVENTRIKLINIIELIKGISEQKSANDFVNLLQILLNNENLIENYNNFLSKLEKINKFEFDIEKQALNKTNNIINSISNILSNQSLTFKEFIEIYLSGVNSCTISTLPLSVDCVFVGDLNKSVFNKVDNLYICGATQGNFPVVQQDVGIISDYEIKQLSVNMQIEPSIRVINQRNRLKCVQLVSSFNINLTLTYSILDGSGSSNTASEIMKQISNILVAYNNFTKNFTNIPIFNEEMLKLNNENLEDVCFNMINSDSAILKVINEIKNNLLLKNDKNYVEKQKIYNYLLANNKTFIFYLNELNNKKYNCESVNQISFNRNNTSISQIETYYDCPFKHFMKYSLKLKENENGENLSASIGTLIHGVAEYFVNYEIKNNFNIQESEIEKLAENYFYKSLKNNKLDFIQDNSDNYLLINDLKNESKRICEFLHSSIKQSNYKPISTEQGFGDNYNYKEISINVDNNEYKIRGKIDRIDYFENKFRIIDYKTGATTFSLQDLYYGEKVQLFVYQSAVTDQTGQQSVGVFYLPIKNSFINEDENIYMLNGVIVNDINEVRNMDLNLNLENAKSCILPVKLIIDKNTNELKIESKSSISYKNLSFLSKYAVKLCENAIKEINSNYINPKPIMGDRFVSCDYCNFKSICKFNYETDGYRKKNKVVLSAEEGDEC